MPVEQQAAERENFRILQISGVGSKQVGAGLFVLQLPKGEQRLQIGSCHFNPEYPIYRSVRKDQRDGIGDRRMIISGQRIAGDGPVSVIRGRQLRMILICRLKGRIEDTGGTKPAVGKGRGPRHGRWKFPWISTMAAGARSRSKSALRSDAGASGSRSRR